MDSPEYTLVFFRKMTHSQVLMLLEVTVSLHIVWTFWPGATMGDQGAGQMVKGKVLPASGHVSLLELITVETQTWKDCLPLTGNQHGLK